MDRVRSGVHHAIPCCVLQLRSSVTVIREFAKADKFFTLSFHNTLHLESNENDKNKQIAPAEQNSSVDKAKSESSQSGADQNIDPSKLQTDTMEVHKHPHHIAHKKKWGEYLLEFLMIFLAVFLGFLAENIREHSVEKEREKQYMASMVKDLEQDVKNIDADITNRRAKHDIGDSISRFLLQQDYRSRTSAIYFCARRFSIVGYVYHMTDGTLMQLKNSGGLRLVRNQNVVDSLQGYYNLSQQQADNRELEMLQLRDYRDVMVRVFDVRVFEEMIRNFPVTILPPGNPPLLSNDAELINQLLMRVQLSKRINLVNIQQLTELKDKAIRLINLIKQEYKLS